MIDTIYQEIGYQEAANILGISIHSVRQAAVYNILTRLPRKGLEQRLIKEQVELFKDKRLSLEALNAEELSLWTKYSSTVKPTADQYLTLLTSVFGTLAPLLAEMQKPEVRQSLEALIALSKEGH